MGSRPRSEEVVLEIRGAPGCAFSILSAEEFLGDLGHDVSFDDEGVAGWRRGVGQLRPSLVPPFLYTQWVIWRQESPRPFFRNS